MSFENKGLSRHFWDLLRKFMADYQELASTGLIICQDNRLGKNIDSILEQLVAIGKIKIS